MALLIINSKTLELEIKVGLLETYRPSKKIRDAFAESEKIKEEFKAKLVSLVGEELDAHKILTILENDEIKKNAWLSYLQNDLNGKLEKLKIKVGKINEIICPNFNEINK